MKSRWARSARADGLLAGLGEPLDLRVGGLGARGQRVDLAGEPGQPLATVGGGPLEPGDALVLGGRGLLGVALGRDRGLERGALRLHLLGDLGLLPAHPLGLGLELVGVAPGVDGVALGRAGGVADPLVGERGGAAQPLLEAGQREPGLLGGGQPGQVVAQRGLEPGLLLATGGDLRLDLLAPLEQHRLVGELGLERGAGGDEVVGEQAGAGVAHVGLHGLRLAGDLGLAAQRLELAPDLGEQVGEAGEVAVGRVELAERLLLALAVLEDAGGLLDEAAAVLRGGVQDRVELALPDDHVHLAADAGVAEQLLHVEQPARLAVDGVLRAAVAEHRAADRDLGVVDRQRAVGVVDGQLHLGAAQRRAAGRAGEDDVLHLAAAQALGALLAHHPREGVDDVGLARAVGADDAGDARLELHGRRGREGLEPLEGQALQVHRVLLTGSGRPSSPNGLLRTGEAQRGSPYDTRCAPRGVSEPTPHLLGRDRVAGGLVEPDRGGVVAEDVERDRRRAEVAGGVVQGVEQPAPEPAPAVVGVDADVVDPGRDAGGALAQLDPAHPDRLVVHDRGPQVHALAREPVGQQLGELPRRLRRRGLGVQVARLRDLDGVVRHRLLAPGVVLVLRSSAAAPPQARPSTSSSAASTSSTASGRALWPISPMRHTLEAYAPAPAPISMPWRSRSSRRTAAESTPSGTLTVVSSGRRLPSAAKSSSPIVLAVRRAARRRLPGAAPRPPRAPRRGSGSDRRAGSRPSRSERCGGRSAGAPFTPASPT